MAPFLPFFFAGADGGMDDFDGSEDAANGIGAKSAEAVAAAAAAQYANKGDNAPARAVLDGVVVGDVVKLTNDDNALDDAVGYGYDTPEEKSELIKDMESYQYVVLSVDPGDKSGAPTTVVLQRLMNADYLNEVIKGLEMAQVRAKQGTTLNNDEDGEGNNAFFRIKETLEDIPVRALKAVRFSFFSYYNFLVNNYFPSGDYRRRYIVLEETSMGEEGQLVDGLGYDEVVLELTELHRQIEDKLRRLCRKIETLSEKLMREACTNLDVSKDFAAMSAQSIIFSSIRRFHDESGELDQKNIQDILAVISKNEANLRESMRQHKIPLRAALQSSTWGRDSVRLTGGRVGLLG